MDFKHQRVGQLTHVIETPLRAGPLGAGNACLPQRHGHSCQERECHQCCHGDPGFVASNKFGSAVCKGIFARDDWKMPKVTPDVLRELLDRCVTPLWFLAQRHQHDVVEVTVQALAQFFGRASSNRAEHSCTC